MTRLRDVALSLILLTGCVEDRAQDAPGPVFDREIGPLLSRACARCHTGPDAAAGYRIATYLDVIGCLPDGSIATLPIDDGAPIVRALDRDDHRSLLTAEERSTLAQWIDDGAPSSRGGVHPPGIVDPRSRDWHGSLLRAARYAPMLDRNDPDACGRCHVGAPGRTPRVPAPSATACTSCHDDAEGTLACGTCHGDGLRSAPPRDTCFFPDAMEGGAHAAHLAPSASRTTGLDCATCHPAPDDARVVSGRHADGHIDVELDATLAGETAHYDAQSGTCATSCHDRGGSEPTPSWTDAGRPSCASCHGAPPDEHYRGACGRCHDGVDDDGTRIASLRHVDGHVDLGDGSGGCGACHGDGADPTPTSGAHGAHAMSRVSSAIACEQCHAVPDAVDAPGHLDVAPADVHFGAEASARDRNPSWNGASCTDVACHGAGLASDASARPTWSGGGDLDCTGCHATPPPAPHSSSTTCSASICHGDEVALTPEGPRITEIGRRRHIDGVVDP